MKTLPRALSFILAAMSVSTWVDPCEAAAGQPGEVLWEVDVPFFPVAAQPTVGPDGTIYLHADEFTAISPAGEILWSKPLFDPKSSSVGADGTIYAGSENTVYAFSPDGTQLWEFPLGETLMAGPTVGPDGNIYGIAYADLGAFSLTPAGELRWNLGGFIPANTTGGLTAVQFGDGMFYFSADFVPGCASFGVNGTSLDGQVLWCNPVARSRPQATPSGNAYVSTAGALEAYDSQGNRLWVASWPSPWNWTVGIGVGPDDAGYIFTNPGHLRAFNPDGSVRWVAEDVAVASYPYRPIVSPNNDVVVFGMQSGGGQAGYLRAINVADGTIAWTVPQPAPGASAVAPAAFSPDGSVAYFPMNIGTTSVRLIAVAVGEIGAIPSDVNGDGTVNTRDVVAVLGAWGPCADPPLECPADVDDDGQVNTSDLLIVIRELREPRSRQS